MTTVQLFKQSLMAIPGYLWLSITRIIAGVLPAMACFLLAAGSGVMSSSLPAFALILNIAAFIFAVIGFYFMLCLNRIPPAAALAQATGAKAPWFYLGLSKKPFKTLLAGLLLSLVIVITLVIPCVLIALSIALSWNTALQVITMASFLPFAPILGMEMIQIATALVFIEVDNSSVWHALSLGWQQAKSARMFSWAYGMMYCGLALPFIRQNFSDALTKKPVPAEQAVKAALENISIVGITLRIALIIVAMMAVTAAARLYLASKETAQPEQPIEQ